MIKKRNPLMVRELRLVLLSDPAIDARAMLESGAFEAYREDPTRRDLLVIRDGEAPTWWTFEVYDADVERDIDLEAMSAVDYSRTGATMSEWHARQLVIFNRCLRKVENYDEPGDVLEVAGPEREENLARIRAEVGPSERAALGSYVYKVANGSALSEPEGPDEKKS